MFYCLLSKRARSFISKNMGNEQHGGTSHHFIADSSNEEYQIQKGNSFIWTKNGRMPVSKQTTKPSWQLARDASMDMLSRKTTKLNFKQGNHFLFLIV